MRKRHLALYAVLVAQVLGFSACALADAARAGLWDWR